MDKRILIIIITLGLTGILSSCEKAKAPAVETHMTETAQVQEIINKISADSVEKYVRTLASFHTRHSGSITTSDSIGIGAARRWIYSKFQQFSQRAGNRLQVKFDSYIETSNPILKEPTKIVNVIAVLPGTQPESEDRMYVISGHYDSRVSNGRNTTAYAPGAADDASGVAAVMEAARVLSDYKFDGTLVFMAVAGEEQGLLGSTHYAEKAQKNNWHIAGMIDNDIVARPDGPNGQVDYGLRVFAQGVPPSDSLTQYQKYYSLRGAATILHHVNWLDLLMK